MGNCVYAPFLFGDLDRFDNALEIAVKIEGPLRQIACGQIYELHLWRNRCLIPTMHSIMSPDRKNDEREGGSRRGLVRVEICRCRASVGGHFLNTFVDRCSNGDEETDGSATHRRPGLSQGRKNCS
jgi:hypothetical protein